MIGRRRRGRMAGGAPHLVEFGLTWPPETFVSHKLERLAAAGFRVTVASVREWGAGRRPPEAVGCVSIAPDRPLRLLAAGGFDLVRVFCRSPRRALALVRAAPSLTAAGRAVTRREALGRLAAFARVGALRPDVIHFEWATTAVEFSSLPGALGCPYVVSCHGGDVQIYPHTRQGHRTAAGLRSVFRDAAAVHCVAEAVVAEAARFGLDPARARLIHAAVDPTAFRPAQNGSDRSDELNVIAVGTLWWVKGFEYAVRACAELAAEGIPVTLDILGGEPDWGEPSERERLLCLSSSLGLGGRVRLHGCVEPPEVRDRLRAADVYVQASLSEGHPTAVVEAMACGLPVVASDCGGTREAVTDGVEGILVEPRDWRGTAAALRALHGDPELRERLGRAGRARVEAQFGIEDQGQAFAALYREVVRAWS